MSPSTSPAAAEPGKGQGALFLKKPKSGNRKTILLLGSGALKIGEAGEFDYSGSQAIKAYREEGLRVVLVNPNIATHQTSWGLADTVYLVPVNAEFVTRVIEKEKPDALALSFGGQTALNCGVTLADRGVLEGHGIVVLGTSVESIRKTEDRALFNAELTSIGIDVPESIACTSDEEASAAARKLGFPVIIRGGFALGGKGSGRATNEKELTDLCQKAFVESPHILVEEDLTGWKEIEYEVVRDGRDNCITVCNMENVDPLGIHTGESIVVAPSQTLDNAEYQMLRSISLTVIRHLGIVGECNIQFALDPKSRAYRVIEVNARLSRSSALASKATGYPLAFVAAKVGLGYTLPDIRNAITKVTCADFEPALDYVAVKVPRWDLQKFRFVSEQVTSEMKSVGEVMALGRTFEEALQKAVRMLNIGAEGPSVHPFRFENLGGELKRPTPRRIFAIAEALRGEWKIEEVAIATGIDPWFLERVLACTVAAKEIEKSRSKEIDVSLLRRAKRLGFSDGAIGLLTGKDPDEIRAQRSAAGITPLVKKIDTLAGEFPAQTNYLYLTYHGTEHDVQFRKNGKESDSVPNRESPITPAGRPSRRGLAATGSLGEGWIRESPQRVIVLGGGPYSIGSSVEFDWCCVQAAHELLRQGYHVSMINSNPETVSTDYDECSALFFEELSEERVRDIADLLQRSPCDSAQSNPSFAGVVVSMGGQIPNSLALKLSARGLSVLGTHPDDIDRAEDRNKFSSLLDSLAIDQPEWKEFSELTSAVQFAEEVGYPVIVRPSYVLSGASMAVVHSEEDLRAYINHTAFVNKEAPVVVSKFEEGAKEIELDGVAQDGRLLLYALSEHIEHAGVHSGDSTMVMPPQRVTLETLRQIKIIAKRIAKGLNISGPFNIQLLAKRNRLRVIECNLRASRSFPFASKVTGQNFIQLATQALLHRAPTDARYQTIDLDHVGVKAAQFSFSRLRGADPRLGVEMASTGEVACFGFNAEQALLCALTAVGFRMPKKTVLLTVGRLEDKVELFPSVQMLQRRGFSFLATQGTHEFLESRGIPSALLSKISEPRSPNIREYLLSKRIDLVINIPTHSSSIAQTDGYRIRRLATDQGIPLITNVQLAKRIIEALVQESGNELPLLPWPQLLASSE